MPGNRAVGVKISLILNFNYAKKQLQYLRSWDILQVDFGKSVHGYARP